jgi:hypothetical protein
LSDHVQDKSPAIILLVSNVFETQATVISKSTFIDMIQRWQLTPMKSDVSVYWWQFKMCNFNPRTALKTWQTVVFPPPVSPTRRTGSRDL